ncbi:DUF2339 domain-containing protein [Rubrivirga marina]|uniref:DUF2339 domain-containing protein n=1 Tax=Rubrivirga marina TaxID=1196024 RepID=UPI00117AD4DC|nr:DUF2339 domain-containing protein [Rubrivirga marina]
MLRFLLTALFVLVALWAAAETNDESVAVLALAVGVLVALRLVDGARLRALRQRVEALERGAASAPLAASAPPAADVPVLDVPDVGTPPEPARRVRPPTDRPRRARPSLPSLSLDDLPPPLRRAWDFATGGNLFARMGLLILFVGLGLLIRYAVAQGVISVEVRLAFVAAVGLGFVALGWRLRRGTPGFGLTLQGGGVATLYLTVYAAYALYGLLPSLLAIVLMGVVAVACGALAVVQNAPGLAVLGVTGGFAAPVLAGTAEGNHVLLLSYYALLNLGVLGAAWAKGWRSVAVVGFLSTFVTGGLWGGLSYRPEWFASVQPFVVLNFAIYLALAVRFALRTAKTGATPERALAVDGALVFGLPAATFVLQAGLVEGVVPFGRAWSAAVLAVVYLVGAGLLRQRAGVRLLADAFLAIGLAFATLALPLAFQRVVFGAMWVLEGAGLVWVGGRQGKRWMRLGGLALQAVAATFLFVEGVLAPSGTFLPETLTGWIVALGLGLSAYVLRPRPEAGSADLDAEAEGGEPEHTAVLAGPRWDRVERFAARAFLGFALFWWTTTAAVHVLDLAAERHQLAAMLGAAALSAALFLGLGRALGWAALRASSFGLVGAGWALWGVALVTEADAVAQWRGLAWLAVFAVAWLALRVERAHRLRAPAFMGTVWLAVAVLAWALADTVGAATAGGWATGAAGAVIAVGLLLAVRIPATAAAARTWEWSVAGLVLAATLWTLGSWSSAGAADPLPTLPALNPLGLPTIAILLGLRAAWRVLPDWRRALDVLVGALGFGALTVEVFRGAHALGAAPWTADGLYTSSTAQAALAVTWTVLALVLAVAAVRRESRGLWFFGAAVFGAVVLKLFLVDLSQAEALVRIVAFIAVGAIGLLIGYRAPLPPRRAEAVRSEETSSPPP